jgi:SAM-dependent methyltransferase
MLGPRVYTGFHREIEIEILDMMSMKSRPTSIGAFKPGPPRLDGARPKLHLPRLAGLGRLSRCPDTEFLDDASLPEDVVARAYRELHRTHWWLGNTAAVLRLLRQDPIPIRSVLDIGCGHGALLLEIRRRLGAEVIGFDLRKPSAAAPVPILTGNAVTEPLPRADVALAVYMAHHLSGGDFMRLIRNVSCSCRRFIVLDLVRHRLPLALFRGFVCPFLGSLNAKDGVTSIRRSYTPQEMRRVVDTALDGSGGEVRHTVAPFYIRQVVDISW